MSHIRPVTTLDLCKNVSLAVLFVSKGNTYTVSTQQICVYIHTHIPQKIETLVGQKKSIIYDSSE